jgi:hypothetical protein
MTILPKTQEISLTGVSSDASKSYGFPQDKEVCAGNHMQCYKEQSIQYFLLAQTKGH